MFYLHTKILQFCEKQMKQNEKQCNIKRCNSKVLNLVSCPQFQWGPSLPLSYGSWIYNYLCNQCLSKLMLWVRISIRVRCITFQLFSWRPEQD